MRTLTDGERDILAELNADWETYLAEPTPDELAAIEAEIAEAEAAIFGLGGEPVVAEPWQLAPDQEPF